MFLPAACLRGQSSAVPPSQAEDEGRGERLREDRWGWG